MLPTDRYRRVVTRLFVAALLVVLPRTTAAQELSITPSSRSPLFDQVTIAAGPAQDRPQPPSRAVSSSGRRPFIPLYVTFGALQVLDAHSTLRAVRAGGVEQNPILKGAANNPAALFAVKAGVGTATILLADKVRTRSRVGAFVLMAALNSVYATVVAHNYSVR